MGGGQLANGRREVTIRFGLSWVIAAKLPSYEGALRLFLPPPGRQAKAATSVSSGAG